MDNKKEQIVICSNTGCVSSGGDLIFSKLKEAVESDAELNNKFIVKRGGCHGFCEVGPTMILGNEKIFYIKLTASKIDEIIKKHLKQGNIVEKFLFYDTINKHKIFSYDDMPFFIKQQRILLKSSPFTDPVDINDYIAAGGFITLAKVLDNYEPLQVCDLIKESKLRGRGGGGFLTGEKWVKQAHEISQPKYIICNGDEGDPGTYMDRTLLEGDPFCILEGMLIAGYATMSNNGIVYVRKEYKLAVNRIENAIKQLYDKGILGNSVMERPFLFDIKIEYGLSAYICGEETALFSSIESKRGTPRVKPPYPVQNGLFGSPTLTNNVETFANVVTILKEERKSVKNFASIGTEDSKGTKLFTLSGSVRNSGIVEVPFGATFDTVINKIGGGMLKVSNLKGIQIGGSSGGILPASLINEKISYENLKKLGVNLGAGGIVVLDENTCVVDIAKFYMEFAQQESCGFCVPCREGTQKLLNILKRIVEGKGELNDIDKIKSISQIMYDASMCGLGKESIMTIASVINYFKDELMEHIADKKCRAGVCAKLVKYTVEKDKCIGCGACKLVCPVHAIAGDKGQYHTIDKDICIRCGQCYKICPQDAIYRS